MMRTRTLILLFAFLLVSGCSILPFWGRSAEGVKEIGSDNYCGTADQHSDVHYFANPNEFQNWIDYRNIRGFNANMARDGVLIVEMGMRPTGGYYIALDGEHTKLEDGVLDVGMKWHAPRLDAAVGQAMITQCVALRLPKGDYNKVRVVDQLGNSRGTVQP